MQAGLNTLDFKSVDSDGHRFLDEIHGNNQTLVVPDFRENAFEAFQSPAANSDPFADTKEFVRHRRNAMRNNRMKTIDLLARNWRSAPGSPDKLDDAGSLKNLQARFRGGEQPDKQILREQG